MLRRDHLPCFIGGFRSGGTLLINLLGLDTRIAPWFETKCLVEPVRWLRVLNAPDALGLERSLIRSCDTTEFSPDAVHARMRAEMRQTMDRIDGVMPSGKAAYERYPIGSDCVAYAMPDGEPFLNHWRQAVTADSSSRSVAAATGSLIAALGDCHANLLQRPYWLNKTPEFPRFGAELFQAMGPCRVVLMIRNGVDVVASAYGLGWASTEQLARWWRLLIEDSRHAAARVPIDYLELRYEDLIAAPECVLDGVLAFLGLGGSGAQLMARFRERLPMALEVDAARGTRPELTPEQRRIFDAVAGDLQRRLGYCC